jgi:carboxylesterase type B
VSTDLLYSRRNTDTLVNHAIDIPYVFGLATPLIPVGYTLESKAMSTNMMDYWINFGRNMDPNGNGAPQWPTHNFPANKNILRLLPGGVSVIQDDFREDSAALFNQPEVANVLNQGPNP